MDYRLPALTPYPLMFLTVSGSHLFGFNSPDSDYDLRGAHLCRTRELLCMPGVGDVAETCSQEEPKGAGSEEMVTHELGKFIGLMARNGGNLVEQVLSPHVIYTSDTHARLKELAPQVISKKHVAHYLGFAKQQIKLLLRRPDKETKIYLYIFRTLMSGIVAAKEGRIESNILTMCDCTHLFSDAVTDVVRELVAWKTATSEENRVPASIGISKLERLTALLETHLRMALDDTKLSEQTRGAVYADLNAVLLDARYNAGR